MSEHTCVKCGGSGLEPGLEPGSATPCQECFGLRTHQWVPGAPSPHGKEVEPQHVADAELDSVEVARTVSGRGQDMEALVRRALGGAYDAGRHNGMHASESRRDEWLSAGAVSNMVASLAALRTRQEPEPVVHADIGTVTMLVRSLSVEDKRILYENIWDLYDRAPISEPPVAPREP